MSLFPSTSLDAAVVHHRRETDAALGLYARQFLDSVSFPAAIDPVAPFLEATEGGKRFRALCAAIGAAVALPQSPHETAAQSLLYACERKEIIALGCALEFYQASALVHDDLLDNSALRRGRPAAHVHFANLHESIGLLGDALLFGRDGAVLVGNLLASAGEFTLSSALDGIDAKAELLRAYSVMTGEVAVGQLADTSAAYLPLSIGSVEDVAATIEVVRYKSARYSIMNPATLGAVAAGATSGMVEELQTILEPAGIAFQLRDDALGVFGDDTETGKPTGIDVAEGKRTVLLALTLKHAPEDDAHKLSATYAKQERSKHDVDYVVATMETYAKAIHEELIDAYLGKAMRALEASSFQGAAEELLRDLVTRVVTRTS